MHEYMPVFVGFVDYTNEIEKKCTNMEKIKEKLEGEVGVLRVLVVRQYFVGYC